jgi:hypothetical protein
MQATRLGEEPSKADRSARIRTTGRALAVASVGRGHHRMRRRDALDEGATVREIHADVAGDALLARQEEGLQVALQRVVEQPWWTRLP